MDPTWLFEVMFPLVLSAIIWVSIKVTSMSKGLDKLLEMHEHPENTGFGTDAIEEELKELNYGVRAMVHYLKWLAKEQTGKAPPPSVYHKNGDTDL